MKKFLLKLFGGPEVHGKPTVSPWKLGLGFLIVVTLVGIAVFQKAQLTTLLTPGESIKVHFASDYRLRPFHSQAKIAFVPVGMVTSVDEQDDRTAVVTVKLYGDNKGRLGDNPSATIRPTTLLGGNYFLDIQPGGDLNKQFTRDEIPQTNTHLPEELDKIINAFQPNALAGQRGAITKLDESLKGGSAAALQRFLASAPGSLKPAGTVLDAVRGENPATDLTDVVSGLESTSQQLSEPNGRIQSILVNLNKTSTAFGNQSAAFSSTLDKLPDALRSANRGFNRLNTTLDVLDDTADDIRPMARQISHTLKHIDPILDRARPVVDDLRDVLHDARPVLHRLVPNADDLDDVLDDFRGPVLHRLNGPIEELLMNPYKGTGPYQQTSTDKDVYKEVVYAAANLDRATNFNKNGSSLAFQPFLAYPEFGEGFLANNGRPRAETLAHTPTDPLRLPKPIQAPGESPHAKATQGQGSGPLPLPMLGGK
jgi:phospholipid/cholesterol/gamma-HCH transport system substrate-binding protein